jgi:hypothetical protein
MAYIYPGWWCNNHLEKYDLVSWDPMGKGWLKPYNHLVGIVKQTHVPNQGKTTESPPVHPKIAWIDVQ